jgi:hypothetical protein
MWVLKVKGSIKKPEKSDFLWRFMFRIAPKIKEALTFYKTELHRIFFAQEPPVIYIFDVLNNRFATYPVLIRRSIVEKKVLFEAMF